MARRVTAAECVSHRAVQQFSIAAPALHMRRISFCSAPVSLFRTYAKALNAVCARIFAEPKKRSRRGKRKVTNEKTNLTSDDALRAAIEASLLKSKSAAKSWYPRLRDHLSRVNHATVANLADRTFLEDLWEDDSVSSTGMGSVKVAPALNDPTFRQWYSERVSAPLPPDETQVEAHLIKLYNDIVSELRKRCDRVARLKLNRVLCAHFPKYLTTVADVGALRFLHRAMGGASSDHPVRAHMSIKRRIDELLGPVSPSDPNGDLDRLSLPWFLYEDLASQTSSNAAAPMVADVNPDEPASSLQPLPATLRRKGLTAVKGYFGTLLELVQVLQNGLTRKEFEDEVQRSNPNLSPSSIGIVINTVAREFDLCVYEGNRYQLSARGLNLLETRDAEEVADHLLTRILGVDHVVTILDGGSRLFVELIADLKAVNAGWTSDFMPRSIISWLASLGVLEQDAQHRCSLTARGKIWATKISWKPESLASPASSPLTPLIEAKHIPVQIDGFPDIAKRLEALNGGKLVFQLDLVRQLHVGLWSHPVRHFTVLTGISGSGKTQLALGYGKAVCDATDGMTERVRIIPVQPAWFDPTPLLGYVSPLTQRYCSAPFLEILLRAADDPERPYVVILDEMNLSHPEQYLAPLLSAMETRGWIELHDLPEDETDVPQRVQYPANLALIGTLNMDETTHGLSDKVLDRAFTLEFWNININDYPGWDEFGVTPGLLSKVKALLSDLGTALSPVRMHFGWRTIEDILRYLSSAVEAGSEETDALDAVIYARVLPKLRGENTARVRQALETTYAVLKEQQLARCSQKLEILIADLRETGSARFWR